LNCADAAVDTDAAYTGLYFRVTKTAGASDYTDGFYGTYAQSEFNQSYVSALLTDGTIGNSVSGPRRLYGTYNLARQNGGIVTDDIYGGYYSADLNAGTVNDDVFGLYAGVDQEAAHTVSGDVFGLRMFVDCDGTVTGTSYLLYLHEMSNIDYGIYQNGTAPNYLGALLYVNETANSMMTKGITINQAAADDEILAFKSSDVSHSFTSLAETDTFGHFMKASSSYGGLRVRGYKESSSAAEPYKAVLIYGALGETADTVSTASGHGVIVLDANVTDGSTGVTAVASAGNLLTVENNGTTVFIIKGNGDYYYDGTGSAFDEFDDVMLCRALDITLSPESVLRTEFDKFAATHREKLAELAIVAFGDNGQHFINGAQLARLHNGAIWQLARRLQRCEQALIEAGIPIPELAA